MTDRACHIAVRSATGDVFSDAEIDDFLSRMTERARAKGREDPTLGQREALAKAAGELTREQLLESLVKKRMEVKARIAERQMNRELDAMPGDEAAKARAFDVGSERQGPYSSASTDAMGIAWAMRRLGQMEIGLKQMDGLINRISNFWGFGDPALEEKLATEMARLNGAPGVEPTGDEGALHAARVFVKALDDVRQDQNGQGAWIAKHEGYIARQTHDRLKVAGGFWAELGEIGRRLPREGLKAFDWSEARVAAGKRAFRAWRDVQMKELDPKTFAGLELEDVAFSKWEDEAQEKRQLGRQRDLAQMRELMGKGVVDNADDLRELMLYHAWFDIVTGRHDTLSGQGDGADFRPPASKAGSVSKARVFHYKDPAAWVRYNRQYGNGSLFQTVVQQIQRGAKNAALMKRYGPNPDTMRAKMLARLEQQARLRGDAGAVKALDSWQTRAAFDEINGRLSVPENLRMAIVLRSIRSWEAITKLGGIVLSKVTDLPLAGQTFARTGAGFLKGYQGALEGITRLGGEDAKRAAELLDVGARSFGDHIGGQFYAPEGGLGWLSWANRLMYRINLFEFVNEGSRKGAAQMLAAHLGAEAAHPWGALQAGTRETMERFGLDEPAWEMARRTVKAAPDGRSYFTLEHLGEIPDRDLHAWKGTTGKARTTRAAAEARDDLDLRFRAMVHNIVDDTTAEPRGRERAIMSGGTQAGTLWGEAVRSFAQFKGFSFVILGRHLAPAARGYAGMAPAALLAHFIAASTLAGWLGMNAKMIARGQAPHNLAGADAAETAKIWTASLIQGGGLGLYGDFLFGEQNRLGAGFALGQLGGPAIGDFEQAATVVQQAIAGGGASPSTGRSPLPGELARLGARNVPLLNLFYTRLALDYLIFWRLEEAASPGYLKRQHDRVVNQEHGSFWFDPTSAQ